MGPVHVASGSPPAVEPVHSNTFAPSPTWVYPPTGEAWAGLAVDAPFDLAIMTPDSFNFVFIYRFPGLSIGEWVIRVLRP